MTLSRPTFFKQSGAALPVALVMLLISTIIGLSSMRSATQQEKISSNLYDRSLAYQAAEAALFEGQEEVNRIYPKECGSTLTPEPMPSSESMGEDCSSTSSDACPTIPTDTFTSSSEEGIWQTVELKNDFFTDPKQKNLNKRYANPQYYIQRIGQTGVKDFDSNATDAIYGSVYTQPTAIVYRVTARSGVFDKSTDKSIVALQAIVIRACDASAGTDNE